jgi:hypothetical protein
MALRAHHDLMHAYLIYGVIDAVKRPIEAAGPGDRTTRRPPARPFQRGD